MDNTIWLPKSYQSQFNLLGAMAHELCDALQSLGHDARLYDILNDPQPQAGTLIFFNTPASLGQLPPALFQSHPNLRAIQIHVDHPFALPAELLDQWIATSTLNNYRLLLPCLDDTHLLRPRFDNIVHAWLPHAIPPSALCPLENLTESHYKDRPFDVVVTGSVWSQQAINDRLDTYDHLSKQLIAGIAKLMVQHPTMGFVAAADLVLGSTDIVTGNWNTQRHLWPMVIAIVNHHRRTKTVESLQGLRVGVFGSDAWLPHCTGTITYAGQVEYAHCASAFANARIALAWGPTQFVHSYSERIMQAMAAGCAVVADDRLLVRRDFNPNPQSPTTKIFDWTSPANARPVIDTLLTNPTESLALAKRARTHAESHCLWTNRANTIINTIQSMQKLPTPQTVG